MLIRKFEPNDAEAVSNVIRETMRVTNGMDYSMTILKPLIEYFSPEKVLLLAHERICLVAEVNNRIVGTASLEKAELCTFFVHPEFQGKGIGMNLLKTIESIARQKRIQTLKFASSLSAVSFYEKMGYRKNGFNKQETAGTQIGMEKDLTP